MKVMMRHFNFILAVLTVWTSASSVMAQNDPKATVIAVDSIVRKYSNYKNVLDPFVGKVYEKFKKNPEVIVGIARAYYSFIRPKGQPYYTFHTRDTANAYKYVNLAIGLDPTYVPAYICGGDIERTQFNREQAIEWYRRAIAANRANPAGYLAYADYVSETDPDDAVMVLQSIRDYVPDYPVNLASARIYDRRADVNKAVEYYSKAERDSMTVTDIVNYSLAHYLLEDFKQSLDVARYGIGLYPENPALNRLAFWNLTDLKEYKEALVYADMLFNKSDNPEIQSKDYLYYGYAYAGAKDYAEAIKMFDKIETFKDATDQDKNTAMQQIANAYQEMGDYDKAIVVCREYIDKRKRDSLLSAFDMNMLAQMYMQYAEELNGTAKITAWKQADSVYTDMIERFPANADFALYWRLMLAYKQDPESTEGIGVVPAKRLAAVIIAKNERDDVANARLVFAYRYLGYYYTFVKKERSRGKIYWEKIIEIDPENTAAKTVLGIKG